MRKEQMIINETEKVENNALKQEIQSVKKLKKQLYEKDRKLRELRSETKIFINELDAAYKELRKTQEELILREKLNVAGGFAADIAQEIKNSLNIIGMSVQHLHNKFPPGDEKREFTDAVMHKVKKLNSVASNLIQFSRSPEPHFQKTDINTILDSVLNLVKFKCSVQKVEVVRRYAPDLPQIMIDKELIEQVILNLIDNALWAMSKGGKLTISTWRAEQKKFVEINVADTGQGISKTDYFRIFDPLFTRKENGTGLGLSIVLRIIEDHKGAISFVSKLNEGTTFTIKLPILIETQKNSKAAIGKIAVKKKGDGSIFFKQ